MADKLKVALGEALIWFKGTEAEQDAQAEKMALPTDEDQQIARTFWRTVDDKYRNLLDAGLSERDDEEILDEGSLDGET